MANGTIAFDTLQTSGQIDGTARSIDTDYLAMGSNKAWISFTSAGTFVNHDSFNVSSLADGGTGDGIITFSNNMANDDFAFVSGSNNYHTSCGNADLSTSICSAQAFDSNHAASDQVLQTIIVAGELA